MNVAMKTFVQTDCPQHPIMLHSPCTPASISRPAPPLTSATPSMGHTQQQEKEDAAQIEQLKKKWQGMQLLLPVLSIITSPTSSWTCMLHLLVRWHARIPHDPVSPPKLMRADHSARDNTGTGSLADVCMDIVWGS